MEFVLECDGTDGLVLMDKKYIGEMNLELLGSMDFLLDYYGETELKFDFLSEDWQDVRKRESKLIRNFCSSGKMVVCLFKDGDHQCEFQMSDVFSNPSKWIYLPSGNLLAVSAGELIQCALYPDMYMEKIFELKLKEGWYAISIIEGQKILCCYKTPPTPPFQNIKEY